MARAALGAFNAAYPDIEITVETRAQLVDLRRDYVDVAIRHGLGRYPGTHRSVSGPPSWPVCSPRLLDPARPIAAPADCLSYPLLQDADRADWALWLRAQGIEDPRARASFSEDALLITRRLPGRAWRWCATSMRGTKSRPAGWCACSHGPTELSYYVVCSEARQHEWKIAAFRDWLASEIGGDDDGDGPRDLLA